MKKITQSVPALLALVAIGFANFSQWCVSSGHICFRTLLDQMIPELTYPLYFFSLFFLPVALILIFTPRHIFISWLKLAALMLPLIFLIIATQPFVSSFLSTNRDDAARLAGQIFAGLSVILIVWKYIVARGADRKR